MNGLLENMEDISKFLVDKGKWRGIFKTKFTFYRYLSVFICMDSKKYSHLSHSIHVLKTLLTVCLVSICTNVNVPTYSSVIQFPGIIINS